MPRKVKRKKKEEVGLSNVTGMAQSTPAQKRNQVQKRKPERPTPELDLPSAQQVIKKVNNLFKRKPDTAARSRPVRKRKK